MFKCAAAEPLSEGKNNKTYHCFPLFVLRIVCFPFNMFGDERMASGYAAGHKALVTISINCGNGNLTLISPGLHSNHLFKKG